MRLVNLKPHWRLLRQRMHWSESLEWASKGELFAKSSTRTGWLGQQWAQTFLCHSHKTEWIRKWELCVSCLMHEVIITHSQCATVTLLQQQYSNIPVVWQVHQAHILFRGREQQVGHSYSSPRIGPHKFFPWVAPSKICQYLSLGNLVDSLMSCWAGPDQSMENETWNYLKLSSRGFLSFFLFWVAKIQPNHWTNRGGEHPINHLGPKKPSRSRPSFEANPTGK